MRYVIVCLIKDKALEFHEELVNDICTRFKVKRQRLPAHFTIKAPFEADDINELESLTQKFCFLNESNSIKIDGFGRFREDVVFMDVKTSKEALKVHDEYIDTLKTLPWLEWKRNEGKGRVFHCTLVSKIPTDKFNAIWNYTLSFSCYFESAFDNISILKWERDKWVTHKEYKLKDRT